MVCRFHIYSLLFKGSISYLIFKLKFDVIKSVYFIPVFSCILTRVQNGVPLWTGRLAFNVVGRQKTEC